MDSGAHFYRCDFQVHSPRDRQWQGDRPTSEDERVAYAESFVATCREKGLDAVAITDHHDLVFFKYIKDAAAGNPIVFPGMELTLGMGCQAILVLDADFDPTLLGQVPVVLGITPTPAENGKHGEVQAIPNTPDLGSIAKLLDQHAFIKDRYILMPHVTPRGHRAMKLGRGGVPEHYKAMPCVAAYIDGDAPDTEQASGWWSIINGEDPNYGKKRVGIFQTSDNRHADFCKLGEHTTWVKWAEPTAEALRQACLAAETRISQEQPELPRITIRRLAVSNCKFLGPFDVEFNPQYNTLIGGRGTGKSTVLEYLRWALCDQPPAVDDDDELPDFQAKRDQLIKRTLVPHEGSVTVEFELNGVPHAVRRKSEPRQLLLKIADGEYQECDEQDIRELLPIQAYSQKQLSIVGVRADELLRLIRSPIKSSLLEMERRENKLRQQIQAAAEARQNRRQAERDLRREETELESTRAQLQKMREALKGVSDEDQAVLNAHAGFDAESSVITALVRQLEQMRQATRGLVDEFARQRREANGNDGAEATPNAEAIETIQQQYDQLHDGASRHAEELLAYLDNGADADGFKESVDAWRQVSEQHEKAYEQAKDRTSSQTATLKTIKDLEDRSRQLNDRLGERRGAVARMGDPEADFNDRVNAWIELARERADLLEAECQKLTDLSDRRIRATLKRGGDTTKIVDRLTNMVSGTRIRRDKLESLGGHVADADEPIREWCRIAEELNGLLQLAGQEIAEGDLPETPILNGIGFTDAELVKIVGKITLADWIGALVAGVDDVPQFEYRQADADFIDFANASAGQQATALLHVLLNQYGPPLIIDQPEEDLDNEVVLEIVSAIWKAKSKRQLIVSSHNANVVVNGDADLVVVFGYRQAGDHSLGEITDAGAIDVQAIRDAITSIMEGGEKAFRLRKEKYGF